jgi:hypothetical protein
MPADYLTWNAYTLGASSIYSARVLGHGTGYSARSVSLSSSAKISFNTGIDAANTLLNAPSIDGP